MKIAILGGTFNPIHYGHLRAAEEVQELFSFDRFYFIPAGSPPFRKPELAASDHRLEMTRRGVRNNRFFHVSDLEIWMKGPSYTVETLSRITDRHPGSSVYFVIGVDAFLALPKWEQPLKLMKLAHFVIISRPGFRLSDLSTSPYFDGPVGRSLNMFEKSGRKKIALKLRTGNRAYPCKITGLDISASRIRRQVKKGKSIKYLLPESVESYIISHNLYSRNGNE